MVREFAYPATDLDAVMWEIVEAKEKEAEKRDAHERYLETTAEAPKGAVAMIRYATGRSSVRVPVDENGRYPLDFGESSGRPEPGGRGGEG